MAEHVSPDAGTEARMVVVPVPLIVMAPVEALILATAVEVEL